MVGMEVTPLRVVTVMTLFMEKEIMTQLQAVRV